MFTESINEGFRLTHRNPQLIYIRIALVFINIAIFLIMVGAPVFTAASRIGMDMAHAGDLFYTFLKDPVEIFSRYLGFLLIIFISFIICLTFISLLHIYVLSGTLGVLKKSAIVKGYRFSFSSFFKEAGDHIFPLMWMICLTTTVFFIISVIFFILSIIGMDIKESISGRGLFIKDFMISFSVLFVIVFGLIASVASLIFTVYSMVVAVVETGGVISAAKKTFAFLMDKPSAFIFLIVLIAGFIGANVILLLFSAPLSMLSGIKISIAAAVLNSILQSYMMLVMWSALTAFYIKAAKHGVSEINYEI
ncbi:MAG: hypothetical protein Q7U10_02100 [Thermodesulfovibrionia bacterium]|nr:hypothetical protein [Thermodesulfovibrionia bacterium]